MIHSYTLKESAPVRSSSGASTVSEVFSGPLVQIFYNNQPPKLFFSTPASIFKQSKQFFLSSHFSPHSSISVIALFPGIEKSCHSLSKSPWLKCPSGDHWNTLEVSFPPPKQCVKLFTLQLCHPGYSFLSFNSPQVADFVKVYKNISLHAWIIIL